MPGLKALFPLDGSDETFRAVEGGLRRLAAVKDAEATFLVVMSKKLQEMPQDAREYLEFDDEDEVFLRRDEAEAVIRKAGTIAKKARFGKAKGLIVSGDVFDAILDQAKKHDLLVMHRLDRVEAEEKRGGGILEKLCRNAPCDVWLVQTE